MYIFFQFPDLFINLELSPNVLGSLVVVNWANVLLMIFWLGLELSNTGAGPHSGLGRVLQQGHLPRLLHPGRGWDLEARRGGRGGAAQHLRVDRLWQAAGRGEYSYKIKKADYK